MITPKAPLRALAAVVAAASLLPCGDDGDSDTATTETTEASSPDDTAMDTTTTAPEPVTITGPDGDFTLEFPEEPAESPLSIPLPGGAGSAEGTSYEHRIDSDTSMTLAVSDYPDTVQIDVNSAVPDLPEGASFSDTSPVELAGRQGIQYAAAFSEERGGAALWGRVYADGQRLYQLIYTGESVDDEPAAMAFFDSFEFTG